MLILLNRVCVVLNCVFVCVYILREVISYIYALCVVIVRKDISIIMISDVCFIFFFICGINKFDVYVLCYNYCLFFDLCKLNVWSLFDCFGVGVTKV